MFPSAPKLPQPPEPEEEPLPTPDVSLHDPVVKWRFDHLTRAGYTETQALMLALERAQVDLHDAVNLAHRAGADMAYRILS